MEFNITKSHQFPQSDRVEEIIKWFDLQDGQVKEQFIGSLELPESWNIGLIIGGSGTGKTTITKDLFGDYYPTPHSWGSSSVIDDFPKDKTLEEITTALLSVGFSSPPSWCKPYEVLSMGEKMRVELALHLLQDKDIIVFDEFTSVVDRITAKYGCELFSKKLRKMDKKFVGVSCHDDVVEYMNPDWVFNTDTMEFYIPEKKKSNTQLKSIQQKIKEFGTFFLNTTI